jgi:serine/threonine-protein kinase
MEILTGGSLSNLLAKGPVPLPRISRILDQIGNALDYAHARDIVHRDLKPPNVLFDDQENAFLTDFGIAKLLGDTTTLTKEGMTMGTPSYMSPEQWADDNLGGWTDIYAMGVLLFEMLTGKLPFTAGTPFRVMHMHLNDKPPSLYTLRPNLPPGLDEVIGRALAKKPEDRPPSATDLAEHFKSVIAPHVPLGSGAYPRPTPTSANVSVASSTEPAKVNGLPAQPASAPPEHSQQVTGFERVLDMSFGGGPGKAATQRLVVVGAIIAVLVMLLVVVLLAVR